MLPKRISKAKNRTARWKSTAHRNFVRSHHCCACGTETAIECAHVRTGTDGGLGKKPSDYWTISLCKDCHQWQTVNGEKPFEEKHNIDMKALAIEFCKASPKFAEIAGVKAVTGGRP